MPLLEHLGNDLGDRYYLGIDIGYEEHVAVIISLKTFLRGDDRWKRSRCVHVPTTMSGFTRFC